MYKFPLNFKSDQSQIWPDLELKSGQSWDRIWRESDELAYESHNNTEDETDGVNNDVSGYKRQHCSESQSLKGI